MFSRAQAFEAGLTSGAITRRVRSGTVGADPVRDVYGITGVPSSNRQSRDGGRALGRRRGGRFARRPPVCCGVSRGCEVRGGRALGAVTTQSSVEQVVVHRGTRVDRADRTASARSRSPHRSARSSTSPAGWRTTACSPRWRASSGRSSAPRAPLGARLDALRDSGRPGAGRLAALLDGAVTAGRWSRRSKAKVWLSGPALRVAAAGTPVLGHDRRVVGTDSTSPGPSASSASSATAGSTTATRSAFGKDRARLAEFAATGWRDPRRHVGRRHAHDPERVVRWLRDGSLAA